MSDSESSGESAGMAMIVQEEVRPLPMLCNNGDSDKLEEFQKLLRSMMDSRGASLDEDEPQDEMNNILKIPSGTSATPRRESRPALWAMRRRRGVSGMWRRGRALTPGSLCFDRDVRRCGYRSGPRFSVI